MVYDLIVLGGGPAGYMAAERAAKAGMSVLLIEQEQVGGVCLHEGCVPTKTLLYSAKLYEQAKGGEKYGVAVEKTSLNLNVVVERKRKIIRGLKKGIENTLKACGAHFVSGRGIIEGRTENGFAVVVGDDRYDGGRLLIATGSREIIPPIPGLQDAMAQGDAITSRDALEIVELPREIAILGGGVIGLEFASFFASCGCAVTVLELQDHIAGAMEREVCAQLQKTLYQRGVRFVLSAEVKRVRGAEITYFVNGEAQTITVDKLILAAGRQPNVRDVGLEHIGVEIRNEAIQTDERMITNIPNVYAAGDVNGKSMLAHTAYREAEVAVQNMLGEKAFIRYDCIPSVIYTNPEVASVGETEKTARDKGYEVVAVTIPMRFSGRYVAENEGGNGVCKLIAQRGSGRILGVHAVANQMSESILAACVMMDREMTVKEIRNIVFPHPTVGEVLREAAWALDENAINEEEC